MHILETLETNDTIYVTLYMMQIFSVKKNILLILCSIQSYAQIQYSNAFDTIQSYSYEQIDQKFNLHINDTTKAQKFASAFIAKAKKEGNILKQADGYFLMASATKISNAIWYADSIISITKNIEHKDYPGKGYYLKANKLLRNGNYEDVMHYLSKANTYANKHNNTMQKFQIKHLIGLLKNELKEEAEALEIFKQTSKFHETEYKKDSTQKFEYLNSLFALSDSYNRNHLYDLASYVQKKAIKISLNSNDSLMYAPFLFCSGVTEYFNKNHNGCLDSMLKFKRFYKGKISVGNLMAADFYLGEVYYKRKDFKKALIYFKKVDSAAFARKNFFPELKEAYIPIIDYYRSTNETKKQLFYINRLLSLDSIVDTTFNTISKEINDKYATPNLLIEKQNIIDSLEKDVNYKRIALIITCLLLLALLIILIANNKKRKIYLSRFEQLMQQKIDEEKPINSLNKGTDNIGIAEDVINHIMNQLEAFEKRKRFLTPKITIQALASEFKTNPRYLSKIVNVYKQKTFTNYINDLRINFIVEELKQNKTYRNYSVKGIANTIGFSSAEVFSKAFYKKTGIYPSFFIKRIEQNISK
jgi:AraC-like DNA-binding protein